MGEKKKSEIRLLLDDIKDLIDVFWMLPIEEVGSDSSFKRLLSFSDRNFKILTFSNHYVEKGAFISVEVDYNRTGEKMAEMAEKILAGEKIDGAGPHPAGASYTMINWDVMKKFNLEIPSEILGKCEVYSSYIIKW